MKFNILSLLLIVFVFQSFESKAQNGSKTQPNIIFIMADDLGIGDVGCYGQQMIKTPEIDKMATEGLRFTQVYAGSSVCAPSRSVLMTGKHGGHTVVRGNSTKPIIIKPGTPTLASVLKKGGYTTACIGKWGIGTPDNFTNPNDVGFDHFFGYINMWHAHNFYPEFLQEVEAMADHVVLISEGKLCFQGSPKELAGEEGMEKRFRELTREVAA